MPTSHSTLQAMNTGALQSSLKTFITSKTCQWSHDIIPDNSGK